uniref:Major facilitator superfamily (MFS) profile domain-containing protein n=1 Tax=Panagrolaimus sp. PS1159 TaxID=55785 RepID=A0AC35FJS5_9BILA
MSTTSDSRPIVTVEMKDANIQCKRTVIHCGGKTRYIVLIQGALLLAIFMASIVCWNPAMIVLTDIKTSPIYDSSKNQTAEDFNNPSLPYRDRRIPYSTFQKSVNYAVLYVGALMGVVPLNMMLQKFGTHKVMIGISLICIITTALTPWAAVTNFYLLLVVRLFQGTTLSNPFPVIGSITNSWSSLKESGVFVALLTGYLQISSIFTMPVSGIIAAQIGWDLVFYVHAIIGIVLMILWSYNFRDEPWKHPFVNDREWRLISVGKPNIKLHYKPPYKKIFSSLSIWGVWLATCANYFVAQFAITYTPLYFVYVNGMTVTAASMLSTIPLLFQLLIKLLTGVLSDKLDKISEVTKMRFFNTLAFWGCGFSLILAGALPTFSSSFTASLIILGTSLQAFSAGGFTKGAVLVAKQFSPQVMAVMQVILCLSLFTGSFIVPTLTPKNEHSEYAIVFYLYGGWLIISNVIFCYFNDGKPAPWTEIPPSETSSKNPSRNVSKHIKVKIADSAPTIIPPSSTTINSSNLPANIPPLLENNPKDINTEGGINPSNPINNV